MVEKTDSPRQPSAIVSSTMLDSVATFAPGVETEETDPMVTMKAVEVRVAGGPLCLTERPIPEPGAAAVRIKVAACGVCHGDAVVKEGHWPGGVSYPRVPGHEIAGRVDAVGPGVTGWPVGQRVGAGWYGGHCGRCPSCRRGDFTMCAEAKVVGLTHDGGYAEYVVVPVEALAAIPDDLSAVEAAPLLCAGLTTFNALRHGGARAGDLVAVQGVGGLGHLGIQFASRLGYRVVAISSGDDKRALALQLGAHHYIDSGAADPARALTALGGARLILATAPSGRAMTSVLGGLAVDGRMVVVAAAADPIEVSSVLLLSRRACVQGWASGAAIDSEETLSFAALAHVRPMVETFPLERAADAFEHMITNRVRFRAVLTMGE
jgi:D-arabinose 1-dehydrogenase-like Zn-dependent alcohol dehydrogenase